MKIILSRKGFDSASGGIPSPIMPDGRLCSLPIPSQDSRRLGEVTWRNQPVANIVADLTRNRLGRSTRIHLDPDLRRDAVPRQRGWRPTFGQVNAAQTHLTEQGVGAGDLFLFFGWFRQTEWTNGRLQFKRGSPHLHALFGWLQIGEAVSLADPDAVIPRCAAQHPHVLRRRSMSLNNTIYIAGSRLRLPGRRSPLPGAGVFKMLADDLILTVPGQKNRTFWKLPRWFFPRRGRTPLTYHPDPGRWKHDRHGCTLQTVDVGQEFVFDTEEYPEALAWLRELFRNTG